MISLTASDRPIPLAVSERQVGKATAWRKSVRRVVVALAAVAAAAAAVLAINA